MQRHYRWRRAGTEVAFEDFEQRSVELVGAAKMRHGKLSLRLADQTGVPEESG